MRCLSLHASSIVSQVLRAAGAICLHRTGERQKGRPKGRPDTHVLHHYGVTVPVAPQPPLIVVGLIVMLVSHVVELKLTFAASGPTRTEYGPSNEYPPSDAITEYVPAGSPSMKKVPSGSVGIMKLPAVIQA